MATISISRKVRIARPAPVVQSQFFDFEHHIARNVHKGVRFTVLDAGDDEQRVRQEIKLLGILPQVDELRIVRRPDGIHQEAIAGPNRGATIDIRCEPDGETATWVHATICAPADGWKKWLAPVLRAAIGKVTDQVLAEDKHDLEVGGYQPATRPA